MKYFFCLLIMSLFSASVGANSDLPTKYQILLLPRLDASLPEGTLAWATLDQLHPTQPQTGKRAVRERKKKFEELLKDDGEKFSKKLFKALSGEYVVPVILGSTPRYDFRYGQQKALGYLTDRTHTSRALAELYVETYGEKALSEPLYDKHARPLNYVIVQVVRNKTNLNQTEFAEYLSRDNRSYLKNWNRAEDGSTVIEKITVRNLPATVLETTDNPFRGFVSEMQDRGVIPKDSQDFSQFKIAETILRNNLATWDEVSQKPGSRGFEEVAERVTKFYEGRAPRSLKPQFGASCRRIF